jgi:hypothetical protein
MAKVFCPKKRTQHPVLRHTAYRPEKEVTASCLRTGNSILLRKGHSFLSMETQLSILRRHSFLSEKTQLSTFTETGAQHIVQRHGIQKPGTAPCIKQRDTQVTTSCMVQQQRPVMGFRKPPHPVMGQDAAFCLGSGHRISSGENDTAYYPGTGHTILPWVRT